MLYCSETWNCGKNDNCKLNGLQYRQLRTITGKTCKNTIFHVQLFQSVKFGPNEHFNWAIPEAETKTPDLANMH